MTKSPKTVLHIDSSMRRDGSVTRGLTRKLVAQLAGPETEVIRRDLAGGDLPMIDEAWIGANFTDPAERDAAQRAALAASDALIAELRAANTLVIGLPIYNFGIPAALKAWIDMIARARETFRYTEHGPVGLLEGKRAIVAVASGGVPIGSEVDFATPYLRHALAFVGITDVELVAADQIMTKGQTAIEEAEARIVKMAA